MKVPKESACLMKILNVPKSGIRKRLSKGHTDTIQGHLPICCEEKHCFSVRRAPLCLTSHLRKAVPSHRNPGEKTRFPLSSLLQRNLTPHHRAFLLEGAWHHLLEGILIKNLCPTLSQPGSLQFSM